MVHHEAAGKELNDPHTIAAIATVPGQSAVAVIRISGSESSRLASSIAGGCPAPRQAMLASFRDQDGRIVDQGLLLYFRAPASSTGEDMLELHCHGSMGVLHQLMQLITSLGVRAARPGEFSERAFVNGKMDLSQAEAVAALIQSDSVVAARIAARAVTGEWAQRIHAFDKNLLTLRAELEAEIDFPEDETSAATLKHEVGASLRKLLRDLEDVENDSARGRKLQRGARVVLTGRPNSGKSTLFNALCGKNRAIVTNQPGTTRDLLQEELVFSGICISLVDTAGLRHSTQDVIEQEGIDRACNAIAEADLVLLLSDGEAALDLLQQVKRLAPEAACLHVRTKIDIQSGSVTTPSQIGVSAHTGEGLQELSGAILNHVGGQSAEQSAMYGNARISAQLHQAKKILAACLEKWQQHWSLELLLADLHEAQESLAGITGGSDSEDLLGEIFSRFCIGK